MFVTLDVKFRFPNIKCNLCQNTVKFQTKTSLLDKIFKKYQLSQFHLSSKLSTCKYV